VSNTKARRILMAVVAAGAACGVLAGCGTSGAASAPAPVSPSSPAVPSMGMPGVGVPSGEMPDSEASDDGTPDGDTPDDEANGPAGPDGDLGGEDVNQAGVQDLQRSVDAGHMPWRADPVAVATMFAGTRLGWMNPRVVLTDPHTVAVSSPSHPGAASMQMIQPARAGAGGVWFVSGVTRTG
jgi:hypothetical protein